LSKRISVEFIEEESIGAWIFSLLFMQSAGWILLLAGVF